MRPAASLSCVATKGGLLPQDLLDRIRRGDKELPGTTEKSYHLDSSLRIGEAVSQSWSRLKGHWRVFREALAKEPSGSPAIRITRERWLLPLFEALGYGRLPRAGAVELGGRSFPISHRSAYPVPIHLLGADVPLDRRRKGVAGAARMSAHGLVQDYLNRSEDHLWGFLSNGMLLRVLRDNHSLTQQAYVEFDLEAIMDGDEFSDFFLLWCVCHQSRVEHERVAKCWLEVWADTSRNEGVRALDKLRGGVEAAIEALGSGFLLHPANDALRRTLKSGQLHKQEYYRQLLRLVYRMIFLFVAEDRRTPDGTPYLLDPGASPRAKARYLRYYATTRTRELAGRHRGGAHADLWWGARLVMAKLDDGCPDLALPALGSRLWHPSACADLDTAQCSNEHFLKAVRKLSYTEDEDSKRLIPVNWRNLGAQEFGSVYESLLELHPRINADSSVETFVLDTAGGHERRTTGSYYTPTPLVDLLLDSALDPVLDDAAAQPDPERAILNLTVCDPACGSGHFLVAAARRMAKRLAAVRSGDEEPSPLDFRGALRDVVGRCIYGVDVNPMTVELCKLSLWMEAIEPGKPLSFLDAHIQCGNSLLGTTPALMLEGIPNEAFKAIEGDDRKVAVQLARLNRKERKKRGQTTFYLELMRKRERSRVRKVAERVALFESAPDDTIYRVRRKEAAWSGVTRAPESQYERILADAWCAAFMWRKQADSADGAAITDEVYRHLQANGDATPALRKTVGRIAGQHRFFHWHLAFPGVFRPSDGEVKKDDPTGWKGGFDVVLGNPPWERLKLQEKEFFASRSPEIAGAPNQATRRRWIKRLARADAPPEDQRLFEAFQAVKRRSAETSHLVRNSGRFPLTRKGDINTYAVFAETMRLLVGRTGRAGIIVPSGIATDHSTRLFFSTAVNDRRLVSLFDFENREKIFDIDSRIKFCLLTLTGIGRPARGAEFAFFLRRPNDLLEKERRFTLSRADFRLFNPNTRTCPTFRTRRDMEIARKMYERAGVLWREAKDGQPEANPWGMSFMTMFDMSNDSRLFRTREQLEEKGLQLVGNRFVNGDECWLPLYEAKLFHQYDHRFSTFAGVARTARKRGKAASVTSEAKTDLETVVLPRYWVPEGEVRERLDRKGSKGYELCRRRAVGSRPSSSSPRSWPDRSPQDHPSNRRADRDHVRHAHLRARRFGNRTRGALLVFRDIARPTDQRTAILAIVPEGPVSNKGPVLWPQVGGGQWLSVLRGITNATNERTCLLASIPWSGVGNSAPVMSYAEGWAVASALLMGNMNSIPLDWTARMSVGGVNLNFYIVKQLPVLPPEAYLNEVVPGSITYAEAVATRVLELTYTAHDVAGFARALGYPGPPFRWDDEARHRLKCELDAVFAAMYGLDRNEVAWILRSEAPSVSFPTLKRNEERIFGEYRTERYVLHAFDQIARGELPCLAGV